MNAPDCRHRKPLAAAAYMLLAALPACHDSVTDNARYQLTIAGGDAQVGEAHSQLPVPLVVFVNDAGRPAPAGILVAWRAEEAGGAVAAVTLTDADGFARADRTLGPHAGEHATVASVGAAAARFTSIAQVQGAVHMHMHPTAAGNDQVDTVQSTLAPLRVLVTDHHGAPVEGVQVQWSTANAPTVTDAAGVAAFVHQLGPQAGRIAIRASVAGLVGSPVTFEAMARAGRPVTFTKIDGDEQLAITASRLAPHLVEVQDVHGNAVGGVRLAWSTGGGGFIEEAHDVTPEPMSMAGSARAVRRLGPDEGEYTTTVSTDIAGLPVLTFTATAVTARVQVSGLDYWWCFYYALCASFTPSATVIPAGRTVGWLWDGSYACDLRFEDAPDPPASSPVRLHGTHTRTFHEPGTYPYRCTTASTSFGAGAVGVVTVQ